jgi:hypothetical protein
MKDRSTLLDSLSAAQRERLAYIEYRLWFIGQVMRKDLLSRFGLATAAGTRDMVLYRELAPDNLRYEGKVYYYENSFKPLFTHQVERVLSALTSGYGDGERDVVATAIPFDAPLRINQPGLALLATITRAIYGAYPLKLIYHSMKTGAVSREIVPLALVDSGQRWHVRAYDRTKAEFRDLVLTRMEKLSPYKENDARRSLAAFENLESDQQWQQMVKLELIPHPAHPYPESIMRDYGMRNGKLAMTVRAALAGYVLRQWQVDCSVQAQAKISVYRLRLANPETLKAVENAVLAPGYV